MTLWRTAKRVTAAGRDACLLVFLDVYGHAGRDGGMQGAELADVGADGGVSFRRDWYRLGDPLAGGDRQGHEGRDQPNCSGLFHRQSF
jgi:hypothetical protein